MMTDSTQTSTTKQALAAIQQLQSKIRELENSGSEPIAVVGMACHFPGNIDSPSEFWDALLNKKDGIIEIPEERWDVDEHFHPQMDVPGKMYTRYGGFIRNIDKFDAGFFGISPREAVLMDPQQRLLLQTVYESFDDGGFDLNKLYGSKTGVYVGISNFEYGAKGIWPVDKKRITAYSGTGGSLGVAAGRMSYVFGFTGPSMIIDTACSSSLVTTHLAIQALRNGECDLAVSAGVNLIMGPETFINFCQAHMLAPDGHCKTFSADADGYARGEGVGAIVLKRLSDAERDGDKIYAVLLGSAVNQDGPSGGLTVPNGPSQENVIKAALKNARISPKEVGYIEAHGTGTPLGDPIEISALTRVFSKDRDKKNNPLRIASVKTNLGHLESAAGIAGLIKTILSTHKAEIPPHRNYTAPNSHIDWSAFPGNVNLETIKWDSDKRIGGVSSFSFSGTNAHVIVSGYDNTDQPETDTNLLDKVPTNRLLVLSGHSEEHIREVRARFAKELTLNPEVDWHQWCTSAALGRTHHAKRNFIIAPDVKHAVKLLSDEHVDIHVRRPESPRIAFQYTGQGAQYTGMGKELYSELPVFKQAIDECDSLGLKYLGRSIKSILFDDEDGNFTDLIHQTIYTQPALFAYQYAYTRTLISFGIKPDYLLGHSLGEYVAATISGIFNLDDAINLVCARGRLIVERCESGAMLSVSISSVSMNKLLSDHNLADRINIAAINTNEQVVVAGDSQTIQTLEQILDPLGIEFKRLKISQAFHSPLVEPMLDEFHTILSGVTFNSPDIPVISNVSGSGNQDMTKPEYWCTHLRNSVDYVGGIEYLMDDGVDVIIEVGPKPILTAFGKLISESRNFKTQPVWVSVSKKNTDTWNQLLNVVGVLYGAGYEEALKVLYAGTSRYPVNIPVTPFITESFWIEKEANLIATDKVVHPLLGSIMDSPLFGKNDIVFQQTFNNESIGFLSQHKVGGKVVLPAAAHVEMFYAATKYAAKNSIRLQDFNIHSALILPEDLDLHVQTILKTVSTENFEISIYSKFADQSDWKHHSSCKASIIDFKTPSAVSLTQVRKSCTESLDVDQYYELTHSLGIEHGSTFRAIDNILSGDDLLVGKLILQHEKAKDRFTLHPALLDAAFQVASYALRDHNSPFLPVGSDKVVVFNALPFEVTCICRNLGISENSNAEIHSFNVTLVDDSGNICAEIENLRFQKVSMSIFEQKNELILDSTYDISWKPQPIESSLPNKRIPFDQTSGKLADAIQNLSETCGFYEELFQRFDQYIADSILSALGHMGWNPKVDDVTNATTLKSTLGIATSQHSLFDHCLRILNEDGFISLKNDEIKVLRSIRSTDQINVDDMIRDFDLAQPEILLLDRCLKHLARVLTGDIDPVHVLFPEDDRSSAAMLYKNSVGSNAINTVLAGSLDTYLAQLPKFKKLRILEVGAGTGGTTFHVLPVIPAAQSEYWYTDVSMHFLNMGKEKFSTRYPFLKFGLFDIEKNETDIPDKHFDIIIAANVLHATKNISDVLDNCKARLAPDGIILLLEAAPCQRWLDLTFGMTDGWWRFRGNDNFRSDYPLMSFTDWKTSLTNSGYTNIELIGASNKTVTDSLRQQVIVAHSEEVPADFKKPSLLLTSPLEKDTAELPSALAQFFEVRSCAFSENNLEKAFTETDAPEHVVLFLQNDTISTENALFAQHQIFSNVQTILKVLSNHSLGTDTTLWIIANGIVATDSNQEISANWSLTGLSRTVRSEYPEFKVSLIDTGTNPKIDIGAIIAYEIYADEHDEIVRYENNQRLVQRISKNHASDTNSPIIRDDASYLITGGFGPMGLLSGKYLAESGAKNILLLGRNLPDKISREKITSDFNALGTQVQLIKGDVADEHTIQTIINNQEWPAIRGIIHAAGTLSDRLLLNLDIHDLDEVMRSKILGTLMLHNTSRHLELDFFITFSSIGALLGPVAQANYAAANSWMDQLMIHRNLNGLPGLTINWGAWAGDGLANRNTGGMRSSILDAIRLIEPELGRKSFNTLFGSQGQKVFVPFIKDSDSLTKISLLEDIVEASESMYQQTNPDSMTNFDQLSGHDLEIELSKTVTNLTARILGSTPDKIDISSGFFDLGMDSLTSIELRNALQSAFNISLPTTLIFKYPNIEALTEYLMNELDTSTPVEIPLAQKQTEPSHRKEIKELSDDELSAMIDDAFNEVLGDKE